MHRGRVALGLLALFLTVLVADAPPAGANHRIQWGVGRDCATAAPAGETRTGEPVSFVACVQLDGQPLAGWDLTLRVAGPTRTAEARITTGDDGVAHFSVQPTAAGTTTVTLCDADGCLYGDRVLTVSDPPPTTAPTTTPATTTPPVVATVTTGAESTTTTTGGDSSGGSFPWWIVVLVVVLLYLGFALRYMLASPVGGTVVDPCAALRRRVAELSGQLADAIVRASRTEERKKAAKAAMDRLSQAGVRRSQAEDAASAEEMATAEDEAADAEVSRLRAELDAATAALRRCERGEVVVDGGQADGGQTGGGPQPGVTPPPPQPPGCCRSGNWMGVSVSWGGIAALGGRDAGYVFLYCYNSMQIKAIISYTGWRVGVGLGGGAQVGFFFITRGPLHPADLQPTVANILGGVDFDVSVGASVTKLAEAGIKAGRQGKAIAELLKGLRTMSRGTGQLRSADDVAGMASDVERMLRPLKESDAMEGLVDKMVDAAGKGGVSMGQSGGSGANIPVGVGLQVGIWTVTGVQTTLFDVQGCEYCAPRNH